MNRAVGSGWERWQRLLRRPGLGDAAALSLSVAQLVAAHPRAALLADLADADLGVHEPVPLRQQQLRLPRLWRAAGRGHAVGRVVPRPARAVDLVSRRDVGAQPRAPVRDPAAPDRMGRSTVVDEPHSGADRRRAGGLAGDPALSLFDLFAGRAAGRVLRRAAGHGLGAGAGDLRDDPAPRHGRREPGLARRLHPVADQRRLLPGVDPAALAAARRLGPAVDLCVRGHARGAVPACLPRRATC